MADTSLRKRPNRGQTVIEKPPFSGHIYSGHLLYKVDTAFEHRWNILGKIFLLIADPLWFVRKKGNTCIFLFDTFLSFNMKLII